MSKSLVQTFSVGLAADCVKTTKVDSGRDCRFCLVMELNPISKLLRFYSQSIPALSALACFSQSPTRHLPGPRNV